MLGRAVAPCVAKLCETGSRDDVWGWLLLVAGVVWIRSETRGDGRLAPRMGASRVGAWTAVGSVVLLLAGAEAAEASCADLVRAWVQNCESAHSHCVEPVLCPPSRVILRAGCEPAIQVDVEIGDSHDGSFREVGGVGVSPVGSFANWDQEPQARRDAFDSVVECVRRDDSVWSQSDGTAAEPGATGARRGSRLALPWRFLLGVILAGVVFAWRRRREPGLVSTRELWGLAGLTVFTASWRALAEK